MSEPTNKLIFNPERLVWWPVKINVPMDGGQVQSVEISAHFKLAESADLNTIKVQQLPAYIKDWKGMADANEAEIPFSEENLMMVLKTSYIAAGFSNALINASLGAAEKNS